MSEKDAAFARFDQLGEAQVMKQVLMWGGDEQAYAFEWLKLRAEEERAERSASQARSDASQREQARTARTAKAVAIAALIVATIGVIPQIRIVIAQILAWWHG